MKKLPALLALILALMCLAAVSAAERAFPDCLRFTQTQDTEQLGNNRLLIRVHPETRRPEINAEISGLVDAMAEAGRAYLPSQGSSRYMSRLDSGAWITRVGTRWMSFLVVGRVCHESRQRWVDFATRVYNMETGEPVTLAMVIDGEKDGWEWLAARVREQLAAHFPALAPDAAVLDALCAPEALREAPFTLSPGHLTLHFRADAVYPGHEPCLIRAEIYYPDLRPYMTDTAAAETDCSGYTLVGLTYDDGPAAGSSDRTMDQLRLFGAQATFFVVGDRITRDPGIVNRAYDAGLSIQSHNWTHTYDSVNADNVARWTARLDAALEEVIGVRPVMMRAPGGYESRFIHAGSMLPQVHWSVTGGDNSGNDNERVIGNRVSGAVDGDIVLLHDLDAGQGTFAAYYLPRLEARGVMLVTLQDLFVLRGVELRPRIVINRVDEIRTY